VVLSACGSGLGKELGGEGLIGLTRAFQYAGARSVMATLWSIADQTTAAFMEHFYRNLKSGKTKDEALRIAQLKFITNPVLIENDEGQKIPFDASAPSFGLHSN
jgi:CHAT domain-containing protein